jgi:hypothetical protein
MWFNVTIAVDGDETRRYAVLAETEMDAAFRARDHFDDLVHVDTEPFVAEPDDDFADFDSVFGV